MKNYYGPFKTFSEAKKNAIEYYQYELSSARYILKRLRTMRKPPKAKKKEPR